MRAWPIPLDPRQCAAPALVPGVASPIAAAVLSLLLLLCPAVRAQTGMCLVIDQGVKGYFLPGDIRRIDMENGQIVFTSGVIATDGFCPRFSPEGDRFAYTKNENTVVICDLDGSTILTFPCDGKWVSWTVSGIWTHPENTGNFTLYDTAGGRQLRRVSISGLKASASYVSQNETAIGISYDKGAGAVLLDEGNLVVNFGEGCSVGPSPDGKRFTNNLWEAGLEHQTMKIWNRDSTEYAYLKLWEILDYPRDGYSWNDQAWSGNSNDHVILPTGKKGTDQYQQYGSTVPWIYDLRTRQAFCFHPDIDADVFWFPYDYFDGAIPQLEDPHPASIDLWPRDVMVLPGDTVAFSAKVLDQYGRVVVGAAPLAWKLSGGGTMRGTTFTAATQAGGPWTLTVTSGALTRTAVIYVAELFKRINCGTDGTGFDAAGWERDDSYIVGHDPANDFDWAGPISTSGVSGAAPPNVYKSVYHFDHAYSIRGIPDGVYTLRMHFADYAADPNRAMSYVVDGVTILSNFNITDEAPAARALVRDFVVTVKDGDGLQINCVKGGGDDVFECGLEILQTGAEPVLAPLSIVSPAGGETFGRGQTVTVVWRGDPEKVAGSNVFISIDGGVTWCQINEGTIGLDAQGTGVFSWSIDTVWTPQGPVSPVGDEILVKVAAYNTTYESVSLPFTVKAFLAVRPSRGGFADRVTLQYRRHAIRAIVSSPGAFRMEILGLNGQRLAGLCGKGPCTVSFDAAALPPGVLVVSLKQAGHEVLRSPFVNVLGQR